MPAEGFEPPTYGLQNRCTTTVLSRQIKDLREPCLTEPPLMPRRGHGGWLQGVRMMAQKPPARHCNPAPR